MAKKRCVACGSYFQTRTQVPHQSYCSDPGCQRERRQAWQRRKLQTDADHRDNKSRAQRTWAERDPDYWRLYREAHPEYAEANRDIDSLPRLAGLATISRRRACDGTLQCFLLSRFCPCCVPWAMGGGSSKCERWWCEDRCTCACRAAPPTRTMACNFGIESMTAERYFSPCLVSAAVAARMRVPS